MSSCLASSPPAAGKSSKTRLPILDGLRGVAAMIVVAYHIFDSDPVNRVNHGYLAVDFFFMLSGYVMGYAYDDRWDRMTIGSFIRRRLVRLHPMVVIGSIIGALCFYFGASSLFQIVDHTSLAMLVLSTVLGALLIPSVKSMDVRGWGESYPLNGPEWSLFFEYIANVAYAFWLRKFRLRSLGILSAVLACLLACVIVTSETGSVGCGWLFTGDHLWKGMVRLLFPFVTGLFLFRLGKTIAVKHAMLFTSLALLVALPMPRVGPEAMPWLNGLYECLILIILLPLILLVGAGSQPTTRFGDKVCNFLGELSYPLYLVHYPIHYVFYGWLSDNKPTWSVKAPVAIAVYLSSLVLGYVVMRFVDTPIRKRLARFAR
jgi:peptidoglycan/LPS O-acetylase OafA/YrhL